MNIIRTSKIESIIYVQDKDIAEIILKLSKVKLSMIYVFNNY